MAGLKGWQLGIGIVVLAGGGAFMMTGMGPATVPVGPIATVDIEAGRSFQGYVEGSQDAPVEIVEFADFQCPACRQAWVLTVQDIKQRLVSTGRVRYVFRDFPLDGHPKSRQAHHAVACAAEQDQFVRMHDAVFSNQSDWARAAGSGEKQFAEYAQSLNVDMAAYNACMGEGRYRGRIQASYELGTTVGVSSTPTFFIGGRRYDGALPYDAIRAIVDSIAPPDGR